MKWQTGDYKNNKHLDSWGDKLTISESWPSVYNRTTLRIFHINLNGISHFNDYIEWEVVLHHLTGLQADIFLITEPNLDLNKISVRESLRSTCSKFDKYMKIRILFSRQKVDDSPFKRGGTVTGTF